MTLGFVHRFVLLGWPRHWALLALATWGLWLYALFPLQGFVLGLLVGMHYLWGGSLRKTLAMHLALTLGIWAWLYLYNQQAELCLCDQPGLKSGLGWGLGIWAVLGGLGLTWHLWRRLQTAGWPQDLPCLSAAQIAVLRTPAQAEGRPMSCPLLEALWQEGFLTEPVRPLLAITCHPFQELRLRGWILNPGIWIGLVLVGVFCLDLLFQLDITGDEVVFRDQLHSVSLLYLLWGLGAYGLMLRKAHVDLSRQALTLRQFMGPLRAGFEQEWIWRLPLGLVGVGWGFLQLLGSKGNQSHWLQLQVPHNLEAWAYNLCLLLMVVVVGPLVEEIFYRGLLLHRLCERYPLKKALFYSSLFFGLMHFRAVLYLGWIGWLLGLLYLSSGSLWVSFLAHAFYNLTLVLCLNLTTSWGPQPFLGLVLLILGGMQIRFFLEAYAFSEAKTPSPPFLEVVRVPGQGQEPKPAPDPE